MENSWKPAVADQNWQDGVGDIRSYDVGSQNFLWRRVLIRFSSWRNKKQLVPRPQVEKMICIAHVDSNRLCVIFLVLCSRESLNRNKKKKTKNDFFL